VELVLGDIKSQLNPFALELSAQCIQQKTRILVANPLLCRLLADDNKCLAFSALQCATTMFILQHQRV
jgi:hypothetical protein